MKDKISLLNEEIAEIQVPVEKLDAIITNVMNGDMPRRKGMFWRKIAIGTSAALLSVGILIGSSAVSPVMAGFVSKIPLIGSIFNESEDKGLVQISELSLAQKIGETKTVNGKSLTIDELFYDGTRFTFSYSLVSDVPITDNYVKPYYWSIDGQQTASGMGRDDEVIISPTARTGIYEFTFYEKTLQQKDMFELELRFEGANGEKWNFQMPVVKQADQKRIKIDEVQQLDNLKLTVNSIDSGPGGMLLNYKVESPYDYHIASLIRFEVFDENGNVYKLNTGSATGRRYLTGNFLFDPIENNATQLIIKPVVDIPKDGTESEINNGEEFSTDYSAYKEEMYPFKSFKVNISE